MSIIQFPERFQKQPEEPPVVIDPEPDVKTPVASLYHDNLMRALGAYGISELRALALQGDASGLGSLRMFPRRGGDLLEEWGYEFRAVRSPRRDWPYAWLFEFGYGAMQPQRLFLLLRLEVANCETAMICPTCAEVGESWHISCTVGGRIGCSYECLGFDRKDTFYAHGQLRRQSPRPSIYKRRRPSFDILPFAPTAFFKKRPNLTSSLPAVFQIYSEDQAVPIGHFVADPRLMPVVESRRVRLRQEGGVS